MFGGFLVYTKITLMENIDQIEGKIKELTMDIVMGFKNCNMCGVLQRGVTLRMCASVRRKLIEDIPKQEMNQSQTVY